MKTFGIRFKELRKEMDLTQDDLVNKFNSQFNTSFNKSTISQYENDKRKPEVNILENWSDFFNVSIDYLLGRTDERNSNTKINKTNIDKNEKDVEELLEKTMSQILDQDGLMLSGQIVDDNDLILLRNALKNGIEYVKSMKSKK